MGMMRVTASKSDSMGKPTDEKVTFEISIDIGHLILDEKVYLDTGENGFYSQIYIENQLYVDIMVIRDGVRLKNPI